MIVAIEKRQLTHAAASAPAAAPATAAAAPVVAPIAHRDFCLVLDLPGFILGLIPGLLVLFLVSVLP